MKFLFLLASFPLLLFSSLLRKGPSNQTPKILLISNPDKGKHETRASTYLDEPQQLKPVLDLPWISMYIPVRSCHRELREKHGEFSPPAYRNGFEGNIWCNWTIWAGSKKHIIVYIKGFESDEGCSENGDKIFFHGVSSLAENTVVYACWKKEMHVFATYARGVHVVFLMRHSSNPSKGGFMGKYYIFKHRETKPPPRNAIGSEMSTPKPYWLSITSIPQSNEGPVAFTLDSDNSSLSASRRTDKATDLNKSLQTKGEGADIAGLAAGFVWEDTDILGAESESLRLLPTLSVDGEKSPCIRKSSDKLTVGLNTAVWELSTEGIPVYMGQATIPSGVLSRASYLAVSPLIEPSSSIGEMELPSRMLLNTTLEPSVHGDLWMGSKSTLSDYLLLATPHLAISYGMVASTMVEKNIEAIHSQGYKAVIPSSFSAIISVHEIISRDAVDFDIASLCSPKQKCTSTKMHESDLPLMSKALNLGWPSSLPLSPGLIASSNVNFFHECGTETTPIPEKAGKQLDNGLISTDELKSSLTTMPLWSVLEDELSLLPRSSSHLSSSADTVLTLPSEMPDVSGKLNLEVQSSLLVDRTAEHEPAVISSETTVAPCTAMELRPSLITHDRVPFLGTTETLPLSALELEPLLSHSTAAALLLAMPDQRPASKLEHALSPSITLTYPFISVQLDQSLSIPAMLPEHAPSKQEPIVSPVTVQNFPLGVEELGPVPSELDYSATSMELEAALSPIATMLQPVLPPKTIVNYLVATEETMTAFSQVKEVTPSVGLQMTNAVKTEVHHGICTSEQEGILSTVRFSTSSVHASAVPYSNPYTASVSTELEHLSPSQEESLIKLPFLEGQDDDSSVAQPGEGGRNAPFKQLDLVSKSELFLLLDGLAVMSAHSPVNDSDTEIPLRFVPVVGEEKLPESATEYGFISSTTMIPLSRHTETQTRAMLSVTLKVLKNGRSQTPQPRPLWEVQHHARWTSAGNSVELAIGDLIVPGTLMKAPVQTNINSDRDFQVLQMQSSFENKMTSNVGQLWNHIESGFPWLMVYLPVKSCHVILKEEAGTFSPPTFSSMQVNNWCNWTIWAGSHKHILIYIEGFEGDSNCEQNQDMIVFQGILSSVENKVAYACRNHGTLIFATQAVAVHVVFLSKGIFQNHSHKRFKGRYYMFEDYETSNSTADDAGPEEPVLTSNSSVVFFPQPYAMQSRHILDFVKASRKVSNATWPSGSSRERWNKTDDATSLETFLSSPADNSTQVSRLKSTESITLSVLDVKRMQVAKLSDRTRNETPSGNLFKTRVLGVSSLENGKKAELYKSTAAPAPPRVLKFTMVTKPVAVKATGTATEPSSLKGDHPRTTHWRLAYLKDTGRTILEKPALQNGITLSQASLEKPATPMSLPKSSPEEKQKEIFHSLQSNAGLSKKITEVSEFQHLESTRAHEREQMAKPTYIEENGNLDQYMAEAAAKEENQFHGAELLTTEVSKTSTVKTKSHPTTVGCPCVLNAPSFLRALDRELAGTTTLNLQTVLPSHLRNAHVETAGTSHLASSSTRYTERLQSTQPSPPYFLSDWESSNKTSLGGKHKNHSYETVSVFSPHENYSILESQHNPGDFLFEITFSTEHKGQIPLTGSMEENALVKSIRLQVEEKVKLLSSKVKEVRLKEIIRKEGSEMKRANGPNLIFTFWLHLKPEEENISHFIHSQLKNLGSTSMGAGELQLVSVRDVNECNSGIGLCGDRAICLNGYGTYLCQCKEEYEDRSLTKSGTLCVRGPQSGIGSWYSYTEILVGTTVFFICVLVVVISVLCTIVKNKWTNKDVRFRQAALSATSASSHLQRTAFDQHNIHNLLTLDPAQLKLRAKPPEWALQSRTSPSEMYSVSVEQSECL